MRVVIGIVGSEAFNWVTAFRFANGGVYHPGKISGILDLLFYLFCGGDDEGKVIQIYILLMLLSMTQLAKHYVIIFIVFKVYIPTEKNEGKKE